MADIARLSGIPSEQEAVVITSPVGGLVSDALKSVSPAPSLVRTASSTSTGNSTIESIFHEDQIDRLIDNESSLLSSVTTLIQSPENTQGYIPLLEARGGTDKDPATNHRRDSIPIAQCIAPYSRTAIISYLEEDAPFGEKTNKAIRKHLLKSASGVVVRVNPGTLSPSSQAKLDSMLCELANAGIKIMSHPDVQRRMGAKDALVKIKDLHCGLPDTEVYYTADCFREGFRKSIAFRPRVLKQNRGSQGEGIWICKLRSGEYCSRYGDRIADVDEMLELMEANDNHVEYHTVGEFLEFCVNGRTDKSGDWKSSGRGLYLEGGVDNGAMLVDQRFLPRIVEGEVRCLMVGPKMVSIVHKVPKAGGLSATLQSGAKYTHYEPDDNKFASLVNNFQADLPNIMESFGLSNEPLPLLWTADYIVDDDPDEEGKDKFYIGEFNCSCVGITQQLYYSDIVAETAVEICLGKMND
jgi:glutathione synthase/RimK-type ligase-like ATP-grasp enzyme